MAQFSHADFGGMSQWSPGMSMVGDMFNTQLKAKLDALCSDIAAHLDVSPGCARARDPLRTKSAIVQFRGSADWWPAGLGTPGAVGAQNDLRYAVFPERPSTGDRRPRRDHGLRHRISPDFRRRAGPERRPNPLIHKPGWAGQGHRFAESRRVTGARLRHRAVAEIRLRAKTTPCPVSSPREARARVGV